MQRREARQVVKLPLHGAGDVEDRLAGGCTRYTRRKPSGQMQTENTRRLGSVGAGRALSRAGRGYQLSVPH